MEWPTMTVTTHKLIRVQCSAHYAAETIDQECSRVKQRGKSHSYFQHNVIYGACKCVSWKELEPAWLQT